MFCSLKVTRDTWTERHIYFNNCDFGKEQCHLLKKRTIEELKLKKREEIKPNYFFKRGLK